MPAYSTRKDLIAAGLGREFREVGAKEAREKTLDRQGA